MGPGVGGVRRANVTPASPRATLGHSPYPGLMHAFDVLGDPVRRRILELLSGGERSAGEIVEVIGEEFGISQPAVSQHLRVLRDSGFATARAEGTRRLYAVDPAPLREVEAWIDDFRHLWLGPLEALGTELARGKRERRREQERAQRREPTEAGPTGQTGSGAAS